MLSAMSKHAKTPAHPTETPKKRRRARWNRFKRWKIGIRAGFAYANAVVRWRRRDEAETLLDFTNGVGPKARIVRRLGGRVGRPFSFNEDAVGEHRARRRRRRNAVLAQEARRRGVFPVRARDFG